MLPAVSSPKGKNQKKIVKAIEALDRQGLDKKDMHKAICCFFPSMSDGDICFLDSCLQVSHIGAFKLDECWVDEITICLGKDEKSFGNRKRGASRFNTSKRFQFGYNDVEDTKCNFMAAGVKLVNPGFGEKDSVVKFYLALEIYGDISVLRECEFRLGKDEYSRIVYVPLMKLDQFISENDVCDGDLFKLKLIDIDFCGDEMCRSFQFIGKTNKTPRMELLHDSCDEKYESRLSFGKGIDVGLELYLRSALGDEEPIGEVQLEVLLSPYYDWGNAWVYQGMVSLRRDADGVYKVNYRLFPDLKGAELDKFENGNAYRVSFLFHGKELFNAIICYNNGVFGYEEMFTGFYESTEIDFEKLPQTSTAENFWEMDEVKQLLEKDFWDDDSAIADEPDSSHIERISLKSAIESDKQEINHGECFILNAKDKYFHIRIDVDKNCIVNDFSLKLRCSNGCEHKVSRELVINGNEIYYVVPVGAIFKEEPVQGEKFEFEVSVKGTGIGAKSRSFKGMVASNVFEILKLENIHLFNVGQEDSMMDFESMTGFDISKMNVLQPMFSIFSSFGLESEDLSFKALIHTPDGEQYSDIAVCQIEDGETFVFSATFGETQKIKWKKGRYTFSVIWNNMVTEILRVSFTVGDWDDKGVYDADVVMRELLDGQHRNLIQENISAVAKLNSLIGLESVKTEVESLCRQLELANRRKAMGLPADMPFLHSRFYGNPGTGKTTVAKLLGEVYKKAGLLSKGHVVFAERKTLIAGSHYDSVNKATMEAVDKAKGGILFIDEAYNLFVQDDKKDPGKDVINTLLTALSDKDRKDWMLILAGYPLEMESMMNCNPGFKSRVPNVFHFNDYTPDELLQIANLYFKEHVYLLAGNAREQLASVIRRDYAKRPKNFENGRYIVNLIEKDILKRMGLRLAACENPTREQLVTILPEDIPSAKEVKESEKYKAFKQMVGLEELKKSIQEHLNYVKMCNHRIKAGLETQMPSLNMVFAGNPGTGKTTVADFIGEIYASMGLLSEGNVIKVTRKDLVGTHMGETEQILKDLFNRARGNVLFIDEAYELNQEGRGADPAGAVLDALVDELGPDSQDFIVILAGYTDEMERLLQCNPGLKSRFPNIFHFKDYSVEELLKIALEGPAAKDYIFTPQAKERLEAYIKREVLKKQKSFGNGRFVVRLITNTILPRMATRLSGIETPTIQELQVVEAEDIPISKEEAVAVNSTGFDDKAIDAALAKLDAMVGLQRVKKAIHNFVDVARYRRSIGENFVGGGVLKWSFAGNSGTGKSTVAKHFTQILKGMNLLAKGNFVEVKGEQIFNVSEYTCDEILKAAVDKSRYGMLFIDGDAPDMSQMEHYSLTNEQLKIKLTQLTADCGGAGAIIIAEHKANREDLLHSMVQNGIYEFDHTILFDDYTPEELLQILQACLARHKTHLTPEATGHLKKYIADMAAYKGAQMANARTMKLLSRTIYEIVMLREFNQLRQMESSKDGNAGKDAGPRHTVFLGDVQKFELTKYRKRIGY